MKFYASFPMTPQHYLSNRAINYGDGVFETMMINRGSVPLWALHMQRLQKSLERLGIDGIDENSLLDKILSMISDQNRYVLKLVVFRDDFCRGYASESKTPAYYFTIAGHQLRCVDKKITVSNVHLSAQTELAGLKHLNRLEQVLAAKQLCDTAYKDAVMLDHNGCVIETISKNIVLIKHDFLYTPVLDDCGVHGVALRWLAKQGFELNWKKIAFDDLSHYDGFMVCNSLQGFSQIDRIDHSGESITYNNSAVLVENITKKWQKQMMLT